MSRRAFIFALLTATLLWSCHTLGYQLGGAEELDCSSAEACPDGMSCDAQTKKCTAGSVDAGGGGGSECVNLILDYIACDGAVTCESTFIASVCLGRQSAISTIASCVELNCTGQCAESDQQCQLCVVQQCESEIAACDAVDC